MRIEDQITDLETLKAVIRELSITSALAYGAIHGLRSDDISQNEAYAKYGSGWVRDRQERGLIHCRRNGPGHTSAIVFSVFEIECQKRAENLIAEEYKRLANAKNNNTINR